MRRLIAASTVFLLTASVLSLAASGTASAAKSGGAIVPGPRQIHISGASFTTIDHGAQQTFTMSEFRVRGNSSAQWPKKPYGMVFTAEASPFGLPSATTFRLLANYHDRSLIRNKVAFDLAEQLDGLKWTPDSVFAELWLNGKYQGSYQIIEEIKAARLGLPATGMVAEFAADAGAAGRDIDGMKTKSEDPDDAAMRNALVANHVNPFLSRLRNGQDWTIGIDANSFLDYYLVREFTKDKDADFLFSNPYHTANVNGGTPLVMGPVWDFDRGAGAEKGITKTTVASPKGWWVRYHNTTKIDRVTHMPEAKDNWYNRLVARPDFRAALCSRWQQKAGIFANVAHGGVAAAAAAVGPQVAANDAKVWGKSKVERPPARGKWSKEVNVVRKWYAKRFAWMNANICR